MGDTLDRYAPPTTLINLGAGRTAAALALGYAHSCALLDTRQLTCWGGNGNGQLGLGDTTARLAPSVTVPLGSGRTALSTASGWDETCAILDDQTLRCWGLNGNGKLGLGDTLNRSAPPVTPVALGAGRTPSAVTVAEYHVCVLLDNGTVKCWGSGGRGSLGVGDTLDRTAPPSAVNLGAGRSAQMLATGYGTSCVLLDTRQVLCWGQNDYGQLGIGDTQDRYVPAATVNLGSSRSAQAVSPGSRQMCALLDTGQVTCWGRNVYGELGLGDSTNRATTPTNVPATYGFIPLW